MRVEKSKKVTILTVFSGLSPYTTVHKGESP